VDVTGLWLFYLTLLLFNWTPVVYLNGFHGDTSKTFLVGESRVRIINPMGHLGCANYCQDGHASRLIAATEESLTAAMAICRPGVHFRELGKTIFKIASAAGFSVSHEFMGHGIGRAFHRSPWIWHTRKV
jgi:methionyl aminopeptidase